MKGKISAGIFKAMAVVSALAIGGGYVGWRQMEAEKANKRERIEEAQAEEAKEEAKEEADIEMMVGSKSMGGEFLKNDDFSESESGFLDDGEPLEDANFLPGSKSISMPVFRARDIANGEKLLLNDGGDEEGETTTGNKDKLPKLLPGSKSFLVIPKEPESEKTE